MVCHDCERTPALLPIRNTLLSLTISPPSSSSPSVSRLWTSVAASSHSVSELINNTKKASYSRKGGLNIYENVKNSENGNKNQPYFWHYIWYFTKKFDKLARWLKPQGNHLRCQSNSAFWWCNIFYLMGIVGSVVSSLKHALYCLHQNKARPFFASQTLIFPWRVKLL